MTVVDISAEMLAIDREVAAERGLAVRTVEASMDDLSALAAAGFDIVDPTGEHVLRARRAGGLSAGGPRDRARGGFTSASTSSRRVCRPSSKPSAAGYELVEPYYRSGPLPPVAGSSHREAGTLEFLHRWEELLGGMCRAGFVIEDVVEPVHADEQAAVGSFGHRSRYVAPYVRIKARRAAWARQRGRAAKVWLP